ncbi:MAG: heavy metal translocating P-type ATPase metal-binding domain-containing protein [Gammaproteobacteria bacterium]|nr:heavy metal translocating P-type ATPase metal-binding domain-containing protein [Gammaproteobacteria bacterium]
MRCARRRTPAAAVFIAAWTSPRDLDLTVTRGDAEVPVCCHGCAAAVHFLEHAGLDAYYRFREGPTGVPARADDDTAPAWSDPRLAARYITHDADGDRIILALDGMRCAACAWLLETGLGELDGIRDLNVDPGSARLDVGWDPQRSDLERIIARIRRLGFDAYPPTKTTSSGSMPASGAGRCARWASPASSPCR